MLYFYSLPVMSKFTGGQSLSYVPGTMIERTACMTAYLPRHNDREDSLYDSLCDSLPPPAQ